MLYIFFIIFFTSVSFAQVTNSSKSFDDFLRGVKFASVAFEDEAQNQIDQNLFPEFTQKIIQYLKEIGFEYVALKSSDEKQLSLSLSSYCEICYVQFYYTISNRTIKNIAIRFTGCDGSEYLFKSDIVVDNADNTNNELYSAWCDLYHKKKKAYSELYRLSLPKSSTEWNEKKLKNYFLTQGNDAMEGIYERMKLAYGDNEAKYKIGIVKNSEDGYDVIYLDGANNYGDWSEGERKAIISKTAKNNFYTVRWLMAIKNVNEDVYAFLDKNDFLNLVIPAPDAKDETVKYLKLFPTNSDNTYSYGNDEIKSSGSGVILSTNGYILTCNHVVENGSRFEVEIQINGNSESYTVEVTTKDPNNDLAILKINDSKFSSFNQISFSISPNSVDVGSNAFALGYPLINTMGKELKVTNGIISSKTGFQNAANQYTISVPVQPGNSGGPLFDYNGNLIGIINAKHTGTENVSYAIKINSVLNLLDIVEDKIQIPNFNSLSHNDLPKMVESLRNYVVLVKVK